RGRGGGGGAAGIDIAGAVPIGAGLSGAGAVGIGGFGGGGGDSGDVSLVRIGDTWTDGANAHGVVAQSLAGGGGDGAINISGGLSVTTGASAGGFGFGLGGFGGDGGDSGDVTAHVTGSVYALGLDYDVVVPETEYSIELATGATYTWVEPEHRERVGGSHGIVAQSIGGGGGTGGLNVTGQISITTAGSGAASRVASIGVGG